jgi:hypothetical protein
MSLKSGFNDGFSLELPGVERELPHHADSLFLRRVREISIRLAVMN